MAPFLFLATPWVRFSEEGGNEETEDDRQLYDQAQLLTEICGSTREAREQTDQGAATSEQPEEEEGDRGGLETVVEPVGEDVAQEADERGNLKHWRSC